MAKSAILKVNILSDASKAVAGMDKTSKAAGLLAKAGGLAAGAFAGAKIVQFGVDSVKAAADLQQSAGAIQTVFKGNAADMLKWSTGAATAVGLTQNEFNELGTLIGAQLKNGGTAMDELAPKTNNLIGLGADLSSMFGGTTADAVGALSSALKGERDPIERYGVSLNQAKIDAEAAALGFSKVGGALSSEAQQAATLSLIMKQTADATGNFAKESNTLSGQQQRAAAQWGDISAKIGGLFLPVLTAAFAFINTNVLPVVSDLVGRLGDGGLGGAFAGLGPVIGALLTALSPMSLVWQALLPILPQLAALIAPLAGQLLPQLTAVFTGLVPIISTVIATIAPLAAQLLTQLLPVVVQLALSVLPQLATVFGTVLGSVVPLVGTLVSALLPAIVSLVPVFASVVTAVLPVVATIVSALLPVIVSLVPVFASIVSAIVPLVATIATGLAPVIVALVPLFASIVSAVLPVVTTIAGLLVPVIQSLLPVVQTVFSIIATVVRTVMGVVQGIILVATGIISGDWSKVWQGIRTVFDSILTGIGDFARDFFGKLPGQIVSALGSLGDLLLGAGGAILDGFLRGLEGAWKGVQDFVGGIGTWIADNKGPISYDKRLLKPAGAAIMGGLLGSMKSQMPQLQRFLGDVTGSIAGIGTDAGDVRLTAGTGRRAAAAGRHTTINVTFTGLVADKVGVAREIRGLLAAEEKLRGGF